MEGKERDEGKTRLQMRGYVEHPQGAPDGSGGSEASIGKTRKEAGAGSSSREKEGVLSQNLGYLGS